MSGAIVQLKDVASRSGFSLSTVSKVLNNAKTEVKVSDATKEKIRVAARELGYKPNHAARTLRMRQSSTIGVIARESSDISKQLAFAEKYASRKGYELLMALVRSVESRDECEIQRLVRRGVDGLLVLSPSLDQKNTKALENLAATGLPIVGFGPTLAQGVDFVDWDRSLALEKLASHLLEQGCEKLCFVGWGSTPGVLQRIEGIEKALSKHPNAALRSIDLAASRYDSIPRKLEKNFKKNIPHGVLCQSDELALAAMTAAKSIGLSIPKDIAITGNSNSKWGQMLDIPLTSIEMPLRKMTAAAIAHIIKSVKHKNTPPLQRHFESQIILRKSSSGFRSHA